MNEKGYVSEVRENLIEGVRISDFESDLLQGDGNELAGKFRAAHSSAALAINTFAPFRRKLGALRLPRGGEFACLRFEQKCPHGLAGRRSPNLDVLAIGSRGIVAVESKCLEPMRTHRAEFAPAYESEIRDSRRGTKWFQEMRRLTKEPRAYRWLDAAQLVKHAFGIAHTFPSSPTTLLYLFWEPANPEDHAMFAEHRDELTRFAASVKGDGPEFITMSYPELWGSWSKAAGPKWLQSHVRRLKVRYHVPAPSDKA